MYKFQTNNMTDINSRLFVVHNLNVIFSLNELLGIQINVRHIRV